MDGFFCQLYWFCFTYCDPDPTVESSGGFSNLTIEEAHVEAESVLKQEEDEFLKSLTTFIEVKVSIG